MNEPTCADGAPQASGVTAKSASPMRRVATVVLAFGANLGERGDTILAAQQQLAAHPKLSGFRASRLRESIAVTLTGPDPSAPRYYNGVALAETSLAPLELLDLLQGIETAFGRVRTERWGDRTLDIDVIGFGGRVIREERLIVPHPRAHERDFVLSPWLDIDPDAALPGHGFVRELLQRVGDSTLLLDGSTPGYATEATA